MGFQDILLLIQTIICAVSLIVSLIALKTASNVKKSVKNSDDKIRQVAIGKKNEQKIKK